LQYYGNIVPLSIPRCCARRRALPAWLSAIAYAPGVADRLGSPRYLRGIGGGNVLIESDIGRFRAYAGA
jgi:hypothetical protein